MNLEKQLKIHYSSTPCAAVDFDVLERQIIAKVARTEKQWTIIRLVWWGVVSLASVFVLVWSGGALHQQLASSGISALFAIVLTDTASVMANSSDFLYSLAESLPMGSIAIVLAATGLLLYSLRSLAKSYLNIFSTKLYGLQQIN